MKKFSLSKDRFTILRVSEPPQNPPMGEEPQAPSEEQETPRNVENPFDEQPPQNQENNPNNSEGGQGKDGEGEDGKGEGEEGEGEGKDGEGKGKDVEGEGEGEEEFGGTEGEDIDLEDLFEKIKQDFERGKTQTDIQAESDLKEIELALSLPQELIKERFKNPSIVKSAIGNRKIFPTDNQERINRVLNEIFK